MRSESFSLAAYCFFFILIIALTSRLACLNRSWSRVLPRLITTFLNLFFTLTRFRSSWSIQGRSFTFRGLLVGMCLLTAVRNVSDQLVREAFMWFSSKHRSQLIKLNECLRPFQSAFLKLYSRCLICGWLLIRRCKENSISGWEIYNLPKKMILNCLSKEGVHLTIDRGSYSSPVDVW